jgi:hypothetical protein
VRDYRIAADGKGNMLAGIAVSNRGKLMIDQFHNIPVPLKLANLALHLIPPDGQMRITEASDLWFAPGQSEAARYLWQSVRYQFREVMSTIGSSFDARSPLKDVFQIKPWHVPKIELVLAIHGPREMDANTFIASGARG